MAISDFVPNVLHFALATRQTKWHESGEDKSDVRVHVYEGEQWEEKIK